MRRQLKHAGDVAPDLLSQRELDETLDAGEAALVVAAASNVADKVEAAMSQAEKIESKQAQVDTDEIDKDEKEAQNEAAS